MYISTRKSNLREKIILSGIILILIFSPFAFGSVHVWAYTFVEIVVFSLLFLFFSSNLFFTDSPGFTWVKTPVNFLIAALLLLIAFQMIPLPPSLAAMVSPVTCFDKQKVFETLSTDPGQWTNLVYYHHPAIVESLKLFACFGMFFLVLNVAVSKKRIDTLICVLIGMGLFEALYAAFQTYSEMPRVLWWTSRIGKNRWASGTFIGANHFAFYMEMIFFLGMGFAIACKNQNKKPNGSRGRRSFKKRFLNWMSPSSDNPKQVFIFIVSITIGVVLLFSASRGGILSATASISVLTIMLFARKWSRRYGFLAFFLFVITLFYGISVGIQPTIDKFENRPQDLDLRLKITREILPMISDYPLMGVGFGNFRYLYPRYIQDADDVSGSGYSHNDWVEAGIELGLAGGLLILFGFFVCFVSIFWVWRKRKDRYALGIGLGVMGGLLSIGFHSFFDFSMHIPANPLTLATLIGIGYAAVNLKCQGKRECFFYDVRKIELTHAKRVISCCLVIAVFIGITFLSARHFLAELRCSTEWNSTLKLNYNPFLTDIQKAIALNPSNAEYHFREGKYYMRGSFLGDDLLARNFNEKAIQSYTQAVLLNPANGKYWFDLGKCYVNKGGKSNKHEEKWLLMADSCLDMAVKCSPKDAGLLFQVASHWVWRSKMLPPSTFPGDANDMAIKKFQNLFSRSIDIQPKHWEKAAAIVWDEYPELSVVKGIAPVNQESVSKMITEWAKNAET